MMLLYALTCQQGVGWQDIGKIQYRILTGDLYGWEGIALAHPLYIQMGRCWLFLLKGCGWTADIFWGMNLFNALGMGVAVALVWYAAVAISGRREAGHFAAVLFGFAHMPWWMATAGETYAWDAALHAAEWLLLALILKRGRGVKGWVLLAFVNGAHVSLGNYAMLNLPVHAAAWLWLVSRGRTDWRGIFPMALAWLPGAALWWVAVADSALTHAFMLAPDMRSQPWGVNARAVCHGIAAGLKDGLFGHSFQDQVLGRGGLGLTWVMNMGIFALNFVNPLWWIAGWGAWRAARNNVWWRNGGALAMAGFAACQGFFFIRYPVPDQATHSVATVAAMAILGGCGVALALPQKQRTWRLMSLAMMVTVVSYAVLAQGLELLYARGVIPKRARALPRNEMRYWALPWKAGERSAELYAAAVRKHFEGRGNCVLLADATVVTTLLASQRAEGWDAPRVLGGGVSWNSFCTGIPFLRLVGASPSRCENNAPFIAPGGRGSDEPQEGYAKVKLKCHSSKKDFRGGVDSGDDFRYYESLAAEGHLFVVSPIAGYAPVEILGRMDFIADGPVWRAVLKNDFKE